MKIAIIGHCGSGKTTLATRISEKYDLPRLELDRLFFKHNPVTKGKKTEVEKDLRREKILSDVKDFLAQHDQWVSDGGNYRASQLLIAAEVQHIVFIDIPLWRRQWNHLKRLVTNRDRHPGLSIWSDIYFTYDMIRRTKKTAPLISDVRNAYPEKTTHLRSYREVDDYLNTI